MSNTAFYLSSKVTSYDVRNPPNYVENMYTADHAVLQAILDDLVPIISYNWRDKVTLASNSGINFTVIYIYFQVDMFEGYPIYLLINGPLDDPTFFERNGYNSVMSQLETQLAPALVTNYYSGKNKGSKIMLNWSKVQ